MLSCFHWLISGTAVAAVVEIALLLKFSCLWSVTEVRTLRNYPFLIRRAIQHASLSLKESDH